MIQIFTLHKDCDFQILFPIKHKCYYTSFHSAKIHLPAKEMALTNIVYGIATYPLSSDSDTRTCAVFCVELDHVLMSVCAGIPREHLQPDRGSQRRFVGWRLSAQFTQQSTAASHGV